MRRLIATLLFSALCSGSALAASAEVTSNLNMRAGPGTGSAVVDVLREGEYVEVYGCSGGWCEVSNSRADGFVSSRYLVLEGDRGYRDDFYEDDRDFDRGYDRDRGYRDDWGFDRGHRRYGDRYGRPGRGDRNVCDNVTEEMAFHFRFGLYHTEFARYCRSRGYFD